MKHLALRRPLVFLDLETTGVNPASDRIIEVALVKVRPDGGLETLVHRVNPGVPIPPASTRIHGITDADIADSPRFAQIAPGVLGFIGDADLAGFNVSRFDIPVLHRELATSGLRLEMANRAVVDAQVIFHRKEPRDLAAAYRYYCGKELEGAHAAQADAEACLEILDAQLAVYPDLPRSPQGLADLFNPRDPNAIDPDGKIVWERGEAVLMFGPDGVRGRSLRDLAARDRGFLEWVLRKDFGPDVKAIVQDALLGRFPSRE